VQNVAGVVKFDQFCCSERERADEGEQVLKLKGVEDRHLCEVVTVSDEEARRVEGASLFSSDGCHSALEQLSGRNLAAGRETVFAPTLR
jgi:hypothetical protein